MRLTYDRKSEKGRPLSRAKAKICLDEVVTTLMAENRISSAMTVVRTIVAPRDRVAFNTTWTYGCPVGVLNASSTFPTVNIKEMVITNPSK